jgi:SAM-dependent methyltransferase
MSELRVRFSSRDEWNGWAEHADASAQIRDEILNDIRKKGLEEPFIGIHRLPSEIAINPENLHESVSSHGLNSRKRALLLQLLCEMRQRGWLGRQQTRMLAPEAVTRTALILRGLYPFFVGTEYLPDEAMRQRFFPVPHVDLCSIPFANGSFDIFVSGDVFEHIPDLDRALAEIVRVLRPGGVLVSSFPFSPARDATVVRASIDSNGAIHHHFPPQYHGNPVNPASGSLVFQLPGWDILHKLRALGMEETCFSMLASSRFGIVSDATLGPFVLCASKANG